MMMKFQKILNMYGIDAPNVVRNLFLLSLFAFILFGLSFKIHTTLWFWIAIFYTGSTGLTLLCTAAWILYSSLVLKPLLISNLVSHLKIKGNETILDLGCGRGMFLIEIAAFLPHGKAHGVDIWRKKDQFRNTLEKTVHNICSEGLEDRIEIQTTDIRFLPYVENSFDVVVTSLTIHNIEDSLGRKQALKEMLRVLKPNGSFIIFDIFNRKQYVEYLEANDVRIIENFSPYTYFPFATVIKGKHRYVKKVKSADRL